MQLRDTATATKRAKHGNADSSIKAANSWIVGKHGWSLILLGRFVVHADSSVTTTTNVLPMLVTPRCYSARIYISRTSSYGTAKQDSDCKWRLIAVAMSVLFILFLTTKKL